jgi:hypothetical protein
MPGLNTSLGILRSRKPYRAPDESGKIVPVLQCDWHFGTNGVMDVNAGNILRLEASVDEVGGEIYRKVL